MKTHLQELLGSALDQLLAGTEAVRPAINLDATKDAKFGDFQTNLALQLAKPPGKPPRAVADAIVAALPASPLLAKADIAGPGFINFFLKRAAFQSVVADVLVQGAARSVAHTLELQSLMRSSYDVLRLKTHSK